MTSSICEYNVHFPVSTVFEDLFIHTTYQSKRANATLIIILLHQLLVIVREIGLHSFTVCYTIITDHWLKRISFDIRSSIIVPLNIVGFIYLSVRFMFSGNSYIY